MHIITAISAGCGVRMVVVHLDGRAICSDAVVSLGGPRGSVTSAKVTLSSRNLALTSGPGRVLRIISAVASSATAVVTTHASIQPTEISGQDVPHCGKVHQHERYADERVYDGHYFSPGGSRSHAAISCNKENTGHSDHTA
jgi:hypothetical protein